MQCKENVFFFTLRFVRKLYFCINFNLVIKTIILCCILFIVRLMILIIRNYYVRKPVLVFL